MHPVSFACVALVTALALPDTALVAQTGATASTQSARGAQRDSARAVRLAEPVRMDGQLTEAVWRTAPVVTGFLQREPNEGEPAPDGTEVRFAYDDDALYVAARMFTREPSDLQSLVTRRDQEGNVEFVAVSFDTYRDRRTAFSFGVTPAGARLDFFHPSDSDDGDSGYNPVWEARARVDSAGWTAEMRIPFNQLRFSAGEVQVWGVNVIRRVPSRNEESHWRLIRKDETGWASRMGVLTGIRGVAPSHRIEALPYVAAGSRLREVTDPANPFLRRTDGEARAGGDLKVGLGPNMTLDVALNPDFGQVEADPAVVNLSAYEVFFDERRPFFNEGASLLDRRGLFYSRRIGAPPPGDADAEFVEPSTNTTILGAAKLAGRLPSRLSVAALTAVTGRELVRTYDSSTSEFSRALVAPATLYAAAAAQQEFGRDASTLGAMLTLVQRDVSPGTPLGELLPNVALSGILDGRHRWAAGAYDVNFWIGTTDVRGDTAAILRQQRSSRRYWQRPDADHVDVDPTLRALRGWFFGVGHSKMAGRHWLWDIDYGHESPGFEANDIGAHGAVDNRFVFGRLRWRETRPGSWYRDYSIGVGSENGWAYDWMRRANELFGFANFTLANYWEVSLDYGVALRGMSDRLTRGGPVMGTPAARGASMELRSRDGARNGWNVELGGRSDEVGGYETEMEVSLDFRPGSQLQLSFDPSWERSRDTRQYVTTLPGGSPATYDRRYIFSTVDVSEIAGRIRANYTFTPNLSLETYLEPFAASGHFHRFGELPAPGSRELRTYGTDGTTIAGNGDGTYTVSDGATTFAFESEDFNERSLRSNAVLRWEWHPGSTLYLVWQQDRGGERGFRQVRPADLFDAFRTRGDNVFAVKVSYWLALDR